MPSPIATNPTELFLPVRSKASTPWTTCIMLKPIMVTTLPMNSPQLIVTAPAAGLVLYAGPVSRHADATWRRLGTIVVLAHDARTRTIYGHLAVPLVKKGQRVTRGGPVGRVGMTGFAMTPRLHYEVHRLVNERWVPRDPRVFVLDVDWIGAAAFRQGPSPPDLPPLPPSAR